MADASSGSGQGLASEPGTLTIRVKTLRPSTHDLTLPETVSTQNSSGAAEKSWTGS